MKIDDHTISYTAVLGLILGLLLIGAAIAYAAIEGKPTDAITATCAGALITALANAARTPRQDKPPSDPPPPPAAVP
jgi:uncharacterized membrane protein